MFLCMVDEGSLVGLAVVGGIATKAGNLVHSVGCEIKRPRRSRLCLGMDLDNQV